MKNFEKLNKIYFSILSFLILTIFIYSIIRNDLIDIEIIFLSFFLIFIILFIGYYFIIKNQITFYPINIFFSFYFLISYLFFLYNFEYVFEFTYYSLFNTVISFEDFNFLTKESIKLLILTILFLNLGFLIVKKIFKKKNFSLFLNLNELDLIRINFFLLLAKLFFILINLFFAKNIQELQDPLSILIASISLYLIVTYKRNILILLAIIVYIFLENIFLTYSIYKNTILLLVFFILVYNYNKKISLLIFSILILWVSLGQSYKVPIRNNHFVNQNLENQEKSVNNNNQIQINYMDYKYDSNPTILRLTEPIVSIIRVLEYEKIKKKSIQKDTLSILLYSPLPRFLYRDKPKQNFAYWYTDYFFDIYDFKDFDFTNTVTYNIFWTTDFYLNFGIYGCTIFALLLGITISFLLKIFASFNSSNIHFLMGTSVLSSLSLPDFNLSLMLSPILLQYLFIFLLVKSILVVIKK